jgi:hypothetical protein
VLGNQFAKGEFLPGDPKNITPGHLRVNTEHIENSDGYYCFLASEMRSNQRI